MYCSVIQIYLKSKRACWKKTQKNYVLKGLKYTRCEKNIQIDSRFLRCEILKKTPAHLTGEGRSKSSKSHQEKNIVFAARLYHFL